MTERELINGWLDTALWSRWGWEGWVMDDLGAPYRDAEEKSRIDSAVRFVLRSLGSSPTAQTQDVVNAIVARRASKQAPHVADSITRDELAAMMAEYDRTGTGTCPRCKRQTQPWGGLWACECGAIANAADLTGGGR